jgi:hypothetical protein
MDYTHYSLFRGNSTVADFAAIPDGGVAVLFAHIHHAMNGGQMCMHICGGCLHPKGDQVSFEIGRRGVAEYTLILMNQAAVRGHTAELTAEGNRDSAAKARAAIQR